MANPVLPEHKHVERKRDEAGTAENGPPATLIHGDVLEAMILTRLTLPDLVAASRVSKEWRSSVSTSLRISPRLKPWFFVYAFHHRHHSLTSASAYDPNSGVWLRIQNTNSAGAAAGAIRASNLLYSLSTSGFSFSFDPFHLTWHHAKPPLVWRENPIVARLGSCVLIAGGTCDFIDDDPLAVEIYDTVTRNWNTCQPMPFLLKDSATSTWISTATATNNTKLFLLEKLSTLICSFDAETRTWGDIFNLNLISNPSVAVFQSTIGFVGDRLMVVGFMGEPEDFKGLGLWEVDQDNYECRPIGEMPPEMVEKLRKASSPLSTMTATMEGGSIYMYDPRNPEEIFLCEWNEEISQFQWGYVLNPMVNSKSRMQRFVFACSTVGIGDLQKAVATGNRTFMVESKFIRL